VTNSYAARDLIRGAETSLNQHHASLQSVWHNQKECCIAQNRARLSIDIYNAPLGLACKDTPLQIVETRSIIEGTNLVNSIPNRANGLTYKPICRSQFEDKCDLNRIQ
jgi:hypothetical protein